VGAIVSLGSWVNDYFDLNSIPHQSIKIHLGFMGAGIYEYHSLTCRRPARADDLPPRRCPEESLLEADARYRSNVIVFLGDLKPEPRDNPDAILAYHPKGLFAELGRT
jgi:hypothetical protein